MGKGENLEAFAWYCLGFYLYQARGYLISIIISGVISRLPCDCFLHFDLLENSTTFQFDLACEEKRVKGCFEQRKAEEIGLNLPCWVPVL